MITGYKWYDYVHLPAWLVVMSTETCCAGYGLLLVTPLTAWISNVYSVCAHRLLMNTRVSVRPSCLGVNSTLSSQCEHARRSALHFLHTMLYTTSWRPPVSLGECHSRITDVSFTTDMTFRGLEGTPKETRRKKKNVLEWAIQCECDDLQH